MIIISVQLDRSLPTFTAPLGHPTAIWQPLHTAFVEASPNPPLHSVGFCLSLRSQLRQQLLSEAPPPPTKTWPSIGIPLIISLFICAYLCQKSLQLGPEFLPESWVLWSYCTDTISEHAGALLVNDRPLHSLLRNAAATHKSDSGALTSIPPQVTV